MKIKLSKPNEWGYYIDPFSLEMKEIKGEIPVKSLIIIKKRNYDKDVNRAVVKTTYAVMTKNGLRYLSKNDFSKALSKTCMNYILENKKSPPRTISIQKKEESNKIKLAYEFSKSEIFQISITDEMVEGKDLHEIKKILDENSVTLTEISNVDNSWRVEYAPNGRSLCKACKKQIKVGEPRFVNIDSEEDFIKQQTYHFRCMDWKKMKKDYIQDLDNLKADDRQYLEKRLS